MSTINGRHVCAAGLNNNIGEIFRRWILVRGDGTESGDRDVRGSLGRYGRAPMDNGASGVCSGLSVFARWAFRRRSTPGDRLNARGARLISCDTRCIPVFSGVPRSPLTVSASRIGTGLSCHSNSLSLRIWHCHRQGTDTRDHTLLLLSCGC
jgi:hypothetical protein